MAAAAASPPSSASLPAWPEGLSAPPARLPVCQPHKMAAPSHVSQAEVAASRTQRARCPAPRPPRHSRQAALRPRFPQPERPACLVRSSPSVSRETEPPRPPSPARLPAGMAGAPPPPPEVGLQTRILENQPYDESLDVNETEDVASIYAPSPPQPGPRPPRAQHKSLAENSSEEDDEEILKDKKATQLASQRRFSGNEVEDEDEDSSETDSDDDDDDDDEHGAPLEGAYNSADYDYLPVSLEIKELFQYIRRYSSQMIDLEHKLKPFIPDFIPAVGDIDAFLKVPRSDGKPDNLGLLVLDEPSTKQSDPTVLSLWLTENSKQHNVAQIKVKSLENAEKNPKAIDSWIESISELHRCKPPATVHYARPMPDIDTLMQEWSPEFEDLLGKVSLPTADINCSLAEYTDMICAILDIPVYKGHIQSLHTFFSLYSEFKNSQHFKALAEGKKATSPPSNAPSQAEEMDILSLT
ncbi:intraflagellar transport protein 46 homolog isoform X2 [Rhineura floridana]|uniref:intraflagellar transport protein 46 homolog isoform X2 n=1 Tax=Rhineura floridana TaxID=261503 RepID=UPI002AC86644|nr:intraflagellar transport protein 46 homolog isoform X2 [Rhineura floridana]